MDLNDNRLRTDSSQNSLSNLLVIITSAPIARKGELYFLDKKTMSGLAFYARYWRGPVRAIFRKSPPKSVMFGEVVDPAALPFEISILEESSGVGAHHLKGAAIVLASGDNHLDFAVSEVCAELRLPLVYVIENIPETRHRIIWVSDGSIIKKIKSSIWTMLSERKRLQTFKMAVALQANGTPAAQEYAGVNPNILTFFDTRMQQSAFATQEDIENRNARLLSGASLRLAFTGRLEKLKGVDHLVPLAIRLRASGLPFRFDVFGPGELANAMRQQIQSENLGDAMAVHDPIDFDTALVPWLRKNADIFVCCHRQSDPSCTYMETLGCGVPIAGYLNRAFAGILGLGNVGWGVGMDDIEALADCIRSADRDRKSIKLKSSNAVEVSRRHSFERTFQARIDHLSQIVNSTR